MLIKSLAMLSVASLGLFFPQGPCPDQITTSVKASAQSGNDLGCGSISVEFADIKVTGGGIKGCPSHVLIIPPYDKTEYKKGSKTFTRPVGRVRVTRLEFSCGQDWFLFIPIGSSCRQIRSVTIAGPTTYAQYACADLIEPAGVGD